MYKWVWMQKYINIIRVLNESQEVDILDVLKASLWQYPTFLWICPPVLSWVSYLKYVFSTTCRGTTYKLKPKIALTLVFHILR